MIHTRDLFKIRKLRHFEAVIDDDFSRADRGTDEDGLVQKVISWVPRFKGHVNSVQS